MILTETALEDTGDAAASGAAAYGSHKAGAGVPNGRMLPGSCRHLTREIIMSLRKDGSPLPRRAAIVGRPLRSLALCIACWGCLAAVYVEVEDKAAAATRRSISSGCGA